MNLKNRYLWGIISVLIIFIVFTYFQDYGNLSWLPHDDNMPNTDTIIDLTLFSSLIALGTIGFRLRGGIIAGILGYVVLLWCHIHHLTEADIWIMMLFAAALGIVFAIIIDNYISSKNKLQKTLSEVQTLSGLIPICAWCKKIRDDKGYWSEVEQYIGKHSKAEFTHGMCPKCFDKYSKETA